MMILKESDFCCDGDILTAFCFMTLKKSEFPSMEFFMLWAHSS